jgi:hypothetical protein
MSDNTDVVLLLAINGLEETTIGSKGVELTLMSGKCSPLSLRLPSKLLKLFLKMV